MSKLLAVKGIGAWLRHVLNTRLSVGFASTGRGEATMTNALIPIARSMHAVKRGGALACA